MIDFIEAQLLLKPHHLDIVLILSIICLVESFMAEEIVVRKFQIVIWSITTFGSIWTVSNLPYHDSIAIYIASSGLWLFMAALAYVLIWSLKNKRIPKELKL